MESQESTKHFNDLDEYSMTKIFQLLDGESVLRCTEVCKSWNEVIVSSKSIMGRFWLKLTNHTMEGGGSSSFEDNLEITGQTIRKYQRLVWIGNDKKVADPIHLKAIQNISKFVTTLSLFDIRLPDVKFFMKFLQSFESLSHLHSSGETKILDYDYANLTKPSNFNLQLGSLTLSNDKVLLDGIDGICNALCFMGVQTRELYLHDGFSFGKPYKKYENLRVIVEFLKYQKILNHLSVTSNATADVYKLFEFINASEISLPALESFTLYHTLIDLTIDTYSDSVIQFIINHSNTLKDLKMYAFEETVKAMIRNGILPTIKNLTKLEKFLMVNVNGQDYEDRHHDLHEFPTFVGEHLCINKTLPANFHLKSLTLKDVKLEDPENIFKAFPAIEQFDYNIEDLWNQSIHLVSNNAAKQLKFLRSLTLNTLPDGLEDRFHSLEHFRVKLSGNFRKSLDKFLIFNPNIKTLICERMNDFEAFPDVINSKELPNLKELILFSKRPEIDEDPDFNLNWREKEKNLLTTIASTHKHIRIDLVVALGLKDRSEPRAPETFQHENSTLRIIEVSKYHITTQIDEFLLKKLHPQMRQKCHKCFTIYRKSKFSLGELCKYHVFQRESFMEQYDNEFHDSESRDDDYEDFSGPEYFSDEYGGDYDDEDYLDDYDDEDDDDY